MASIVGKKIVVIGGNGTLGSAAVEAAVAANAHVTILSRSAKSTSGAAPLQGSVSDPSSVGVAVAGAFGIVISVEANRSPEQLNAVYVEGTRNVLAAAARDAHIVFMSHIGITDIERMPDYNRAKLEAERLIRASGLSYTIIRPAWVVSGSKGVKFEQGDHHTGRRDDIGRGDLGRTIIAAFENPEAQFKTFELYGGGPMKPDWGREFLRLETDAKEDSYGN